MPEDLIPEDEPIFPKSNPKESKKPRNLKERFFDFYYSTIPYFNVNLAWFVMSLPILTIFPALGGLYYAVMEQNQGNSAEWGTVWEGFKKHWWLSVKWGLLVTVVDALLVINIWFYTNLTQTWATFAMTITIVLLIVWIAINQFSFPLLLLQEEEKIGLAIRNGYVVVMRQPVQALKVLALNLLITVISIILPPLWIFISMALIVHIQTSTLQNAIDQIHAKDAHRDATKAHRNGTGLEDDEIEQNNGDKD
jgi:uncharacterized membrane protein YesL